MFQDVIETNHIEPRTTKIDTGQTAFPERTGKILCLRRKANVRSESLPAILFCKPKERSVSTADVEDAAFFSDEPFEVGELSRVCGLVVCIFVSGTVVF